MKILITGIKGFIGSEIASKLLSEKFEIVGLSKNEPIVNSRHKILNADITDREAVLKLRQERSFDAVIHSAGLAHQFGKIEKENFEEVNVGGTKNILELAVKTKVQHFILLSSTAVYGLQNKPMDESSECKPETFYAESKLEAENVCREVCEDNNIALTIFRLAPVLGEKGVGNVPRLINLIYKKKFIWVGNGENEKSLIYVGDIANACLTLLRNKKNASEVFNLAAQPIKMQNLVSIISENLNKNIPHISIPVFIPKLFFGINFKITKIKSMDTMAQTFEKWLSEDIYPADKIKTEYGFVPETAVEQAVKRQCERFLERQGN